MTEENAGLCCLVGKNTCKKQKQTNNQKNIEPKLISQNMLLCVPTEEKKVISVWNNIRVSKRMLIFE